MSGTVRLTVLLACYGRPMTTYDMESEALNILLSGEVQQGLSIGLDELEELFMLLAADAERQDPAVLLLYLDFAPDGEGPVGYDVFDEAFGILGQSTGLEDWSYLLTDSTFDWRINLGGILNSDDEGETTYQIGFEPCYAAIQQLSNPDIRTLVADTLQSLTVPGNRNEELRRYCIAYLREEDMWNWDKSSVYED